MPSKGSRLYDTARWKKKRAAFLRANPLCVYCKQAGRTTGATVVDHIIPHKGDLRLFWSTSNWAASCAPCHDGAKREQERSGGPMRGCDEDGVPLDPSHRWNG